MTDSKEINYFVDEAGSGIIFDRKGKVVIGEDGCAKYFYLGLLEVNDINSLSSAMIRLGKRIIKDQYLKGIPSVEKRSNSSRFPFHATDDVPEIRRDVYRILESEDVKFFAVVKDMNKVLDYVRSRNQKEPDYRYNPNELYDFTVRALFKGRLHKNSEYTICFARRGKSDRTRALTRAIETARDRFANQWNIDITSSVGLKVKYSHEHPGLQAVDYFLWALQRCYERGEDRYLKFMVLR